jgi:hypothetical protein
MTATKSQTNNYLDLLIVGTLAGQTSLSKVGQDTSGLMSGITDKIKSYVSNNVDPNDKVGSVINMLAPGVISTTFGAFGLGKIGMLLGLAARFFHIDVAGILRSIWQELKSELSKGQTTSDKVDQIVQNAVQEHSTPATPQEAEMAQNQTSQAQDLRQAQLLSLALDAYQVDLLKNGAPKNDGWFSYFSGKKGKTTSVLSRILSFLFRVIIASAGLMVAGDLMNHFLNRPNAIDNPIRGGQPVGPGTETPVTTTTQTTQTNLPINPSYQDTVRNSSTLNWIESVPNNQSSISQMLINFAKDVYSGLEGQESIIQNSPLFQNVAETIAWYNHTSAGEPIVFIPRMFATKKQLVDSFIDDVVSKIPKK